MMPSHSTESQEPRSQETMTFLESLTEDLNIVTVRRDFIGRG